MESSVLHLSLLSMYFTPAHGHSRSVREQMLQLLILREHQWVEKHGGSEAVKEAVKPPPPPMTCDKQVNTEVVRTMDRAVQVEMEQPLPVSVVSPVKGKCYSEDFVSCRAFLSWTY